MPDLWLSRQSENDVWRGRWMNAFSGCLLVDRMLEKWTTLLLASARLSVALILQILRQPEKRLTLRQSSSSRFQAAFSMAIHPANANSGFSGCLDYMATHITMRCNNHRISYTNYFCSPPVTTIFICSGLMWRCHAARMSSALMALILLL
nr:hypothetical protein [uncultured Kingella sp.]